MNIICFMREQQMGKTWYFARYFEMVNCILTENAWRELHDEDFFEFWLNK